MNIQAIIRQQGIEPLKASIDSSERDFKRLGYTKTEIKETLNEIFRGHDANLDNYLTMRGY